MSDDAFEDPPRQAPDGGMLQVDLGGYAGPLDLLLDLAKRNQIDLSTLKILPLAEQYLAYIDQAKALSIELAADMLIMAAWLAWLKSRLLAPETAADDEPAADAMAGALAHRLRRLNAMREAADALFARPMLGRDIHARGIAEPVTVVRQTTYHATLYDLLVAYGGIRQQELSRTVTVEKRPVFSLVDARVLLTRMVGPSAGWMPLTLLASAMPTGDPKARLAASFGAALEMAREGALTLQQSDPFAPLYLRAGEAQREQTDG